jgi:hypothetical protein
MTEWICSIDDDVLLAELRSQLETSDFFDDQFSPQDEENPVIHLIVGRTDSPSFKIEVFANEHPPPHFRVQYAGETANYRIKDCQQLNGGLLRYERLIRKWHSKNKPKLIEAWNNFRPSDCPVGEYVEN